LREIRQINASFWAQVGGGSSAGRAFVFEGNSPRILAQQKTNRFARKSTWVYCNPAGFTYTENEVKLVGSVLAKRNFLGPLPARKKKLEEQTFTALL